MTLSVIIITKNEERNIRKCLESVRFADEIIVLDSGSTDKTVAIAKEYTEHVFLQIGQVMVLKNKGHYQKLRETGCSILTLMSL